MFKKYLCFQRLRERNNIIEFPSQFNITVIEISLFGSQDHSAVYIMSTHIKIYIRIAL